MVSNSHGTSEPGDATALLSAHRKLRRRVDVDLEVVLLAAEIQVRGGRAAVEVDL